MKKLLLFSVFLVCLILLSSAKIASAKDVSYSVVFVTSPDSQNTFPSHAIRLDNVSLNVEIADTPSKMEQGLQFQDPLPYNQGMLFVNQSPQVLPMWMPNMKFSLDIIWFDGNGNVLHIERDVPPCTSPNYSTCPIYNTNGLPSKYALEVTSGFVERYHISMNSRLVTQIPEFGSLAGLIIAIAIIGVLSISQKFRFHF